MNKKLTSIRITEEAMRLRNLLVQKLGISKSAVLELAIRELAKRENVQ